MPCTTAATPTTSMLTDRYELTMVEAARRGGVADQRAVFEVFGRSLPAGRRYGVVAGTGRVLEAIEAFRFDADDVAYLLDAGVVTRAMGEWLRTFRFTGDVDGLREGELYGPNTPVLTIEATFAEAVLLETVVLSIMNHDTAVASAAARMVGAAGGKPLIDMGGRRTHELAAPAAARAAYLAGFASTSNLAAGERYGIPTTGTAAHAFTLAFANELDAFVAQLDEFGTGTTLLVDTFDVDEGIRNAVTAARRFGARGPGAVRLDSGDLAVEARRARAQLDELGARDTRIVLTGDLDEHAIAALELDGVPADVYGVGTRVATGSGHPTANFVYKLVAIADRDGGPLRAVEKRSAGKATVGGRKRVWRRLDADGVLVGDQFDLTPDPDPDGTATAAAVAETLATATPAQRALQVPMIRGGARVHDPSLDEVRAHHRQVWDELPAAARDLVDGPAAITLERAAAAEPAATDGGGVP